MSEQADPGPQTIDQVTTHLTEWARQVLRGVQISQAPPGRQPSTLEVSVYLLDLAHKPALRGPRSPPLQVLLRYLVSAWGPEPAAVHHALHQLVFAALTRPDLEVSETPIPAALWSAFGTPPRPSFVLYYPLRVEPYERNVPLVRRADVRPVVAVPTLHGRLLVPNAGPAGETIALSGARVEVPGARSSTTSDRGGYFRLENVLPNAQGVIQLSIQAKGNTFEMQLHEMGTAGAPATIEVPWPSARLVAKLVDARGAPIPGVRVELPDQRQYVNTRADGGFVLDGLPARVRSQQIVARQGGEQLDVRTQEGVVVLTRRGGASSAPVVIQLE